MPSAIVDHKIPEIEKCLNELKAANKEGDIERLEKSIKKLDNAVFSLRVEIFWRQRRAKERKECG